MTRREFTGKTKAQAFTRAKGHCEGCGVRLTVGKFAYDHVLPDALGGEPVLSNCAVLCFACHSVKTASEDVPRIRKADRQKRAQIGAKKRGRGFAPAERNGRASAPLTKQLPPRRL